MSVEFYNEEVEELENKIRTSILKLKRAKGSEQQNLIKEVNDYIKSAEKKFKRLKSNMKSYDEEDKGIWEKKVTFHGKELQTLKQHLMSAKDEAAQNELLEITHEEKKKNNSKKKKIKKKPEKVEVVQSSTDTVQDDALVDELFKEVFETQDKSMAVINRILSKIDESQALANDSAAILQQQKEQLLKIDEEMDKLGSNINQAGKELTSFMRRMATDKLILVIVAVVACIIFLCIVGFAVCKIPAIPTSSGTVSVCIFIFQQIKGD